MPVTNDPLSSIDRSALDMELEFLETAMGLLVARVARVRSAVIVKNIMML